MDVADFAEWSNLADMGLPSCNESPWISGAAVELCFVEDCACVFDSEILVLLERRAVHHRFYHFFDGAIEAFNYTVKLRRVTGRDLVNDAHLRVPVIGFDARKFAAAIRSNDFDLIRSHLLVKKDDGLLDGGEGLVL